jgi:hypothetical protein
MSVEYQKNIYLVDSTGHIRLTGNNRLHDNRSILQIEGLKDIADEILSRKKQDFQYSVKRGALFASCAVYARSTFVFICRREKKTKRLPMCVMLYILT